MLQEGLTHRLRSSKPCYTMQLNNISSFEVRKIFVWLDLYEYTDEFMKHDKLKNAEILNKVKG